MNKRFTAERAAAVDSSGIRKVFDLAAKMKDPINLSIGLPDFDVPDDAKRVAVDAINRGENRYTQTQGTALLREKLRAELSSEFGRDVGDVLVTSGVSGGLSLVTWAVMNPGDEAVFLDPYFVMYRHLMTLAGAVGVPVPSYPAFRFDAAKVEACITPRTKMLILNSPANPTGIVMTAAELDSAVELARKYDLLIVSDEIYEPFTYGATGKTRLLSALSSYEKTVVLRGFSKSHAMTGWRLGYAFGMQEVVQQMTKLQQYTFVCAPSPMQAAAASAIHIDISAHVAAYKHKRDLAVEILSRKFEISRPDGAFYVFPKAPAGMTGSQFAELAVAKNVLIIPGNVFSSQDTHFRISYATTDERLVKGCEILCSLA